MTLYRHTQVGTLLIWIFSLSFLFLLILTPLAQFFTGMIALFLAILLLFGWLTVEISPEFLVCLFGVGLIRKRLALRDIEEVQAVRNRWYYGWGIRLTPYGWLYNVSGLNAVQIRMSIGKSYRIGTDQPQELLRAISESSNCEVRS